MCNFYVTSDDLLEILKDFDIAGPGELMIQESECLKVVMFEIIKFS